MRSLCVEPPLSAVSSHVSITRCSSEHRLWLSRCSSDNDQESGLRQLTANVGVERGKWIVDGAEKLDNCLVVGNNDNTLKDGEAKTTMT